MSFKQIDFDFFWDFVGKSNWVSDHDYNRINILYNQYPQSEMNLIKDVYSYFLDELGEKFYDVWLGNDGGSGIEVSDDGWWDLRAEVIGRGKDFYNNITVEKLQEMAINNDYYENFGYSFTD